ncbi:hypothetical protein HPB50_006247 [Hyalomma asiaticum]|uniref:Uncharacterized protein n=1 Tax=Hyalomma asiaticum TaxID=266040 RepID=A0ACB7TFP1_HYAAI|nr:hypothetical protein HPB50_006247 [Hyalomma asiaticum]
MRNLEPLDSLPVRLWSREGTIVPRVDSVRILGLWIDARGCNGGAIKRLGGQASNILRLISPITNEREDIQVDPIPRNIHPVHHVGRREARARAILRSAGSDAKAALFVDALEYSTRREGLWGQLVARASVCTDQVTVEGEMAIVLALQAAEVPCVVYSDSRSAVRAFSGGLISEQVARLRRSGRRQARWAGSHISWFPAHVEGTDGVNPNASAHTLARECTNSARGGEASGGNTDLRKDPLTAFHEITSSYKLSRRRFPLPNASINRAQGITFRLLQTDTYLCPRTYRRIAPDIQEEYPRCGLESCSLTHMLWQCPAKVGAD